MSSHDPAQPVAQQGPKHFFSEQRELLTGDTTAGRFRREFNLYKQLFGPATFIRIVATNDCDLLFFDEMQDRYEQYYEGTVLERGLIANRALRIINENWTKIQVVGPQGTVVSVYASRIPDTTGQPVQGETSPPTKR